jgi:hypothetical protein
MFIIALKCPLLIAGFEPCGSGSALVAAASFVESSSRQHAGLDLRRKQEEGCWLQEEEGCRLLEDEW